jgi:predicted nucleic acid-binding protein
VKLVRHEPETHALRAELERWQSLASSRLAWIEVRRAGARGDVPPRMTAAVLDVLDEIPLDDQIAEAAATLEPIGLRTLDAVHVASALILGESLGIVVTYDRRMAQAATAAGLRAAAPTS